MPDYIYLLANRLSPSQQSALQSIRDAARDAGMTVFLTGGAVRDLTSGSPVRDIDVSVQGNALDLKSAFELAGAVIWGEDAASQTIFARFPGSVRVEVSSTRSEEYPTPGKPVYHPGSILEDLRRRDFTANAMALSLNEGSYGLLMDPLNGVADLEARVLRLVSNYGFLEDPIRLIRAARLQARLGWELEERTKARVENAKEEGVLSHITPYQQGYELEEILHEEDGLKVLRALEADGSIKALFPAWTSGKVDIEALESLRELLTQLQMQGVNPDPSAAQAQLLTAKLLPKDLAALKKLFVRPGFVQEWESQEERSKEVGRRLLGKEAATPSAAWKLLTSIDPEAVLWLGLTSKSAAVQAKLKDFFTVWPEARQRIPYALMQEMRITPELEGYQALLRSLFFELIDGKLNSDEEVRQFLEPHSPPAPPPPVTIRRPRAKKGAEKHKVREIDEEDASDNRSGDEDEDGEDDEGGEEEMGREELIPRSLPPPIATPAPSILRPDPIADEPMDDGGEDDEPERKEAAVASEAEMKPAEALLPDSHAPSEEKLQGKSEANTASKSTKLPKSMAVPPTHRVQAPTKSAGKSAPPKAAAKKSAAKAPAAKPAPSKPPAKTPGKTVAKKTATKPGVKNKSVKPAASRAKSAPAKVIKKPVTTKAKPIVKKSKVVKKAAKPAPAKKKR